MSEHLEERIEAVAKAGLQLFADEFEDHTGRLNVVTLYATDGHDYSHLKEHLSEEAEVLEDDLFFLNSPLTIKNETVALVRLEHPDGEHSQIGECDFALDDWLEFETKNKKKKWVEIIDEEEFHMVRFTDPEKDVILVFTNPPVSISESVEIVDEDADGVNEDYE